MQAEHGAVAEIGALSCVRAFKPNDLDTMTFSHFKSARTSSLSCAEASLKALASGMYHEALLLRKEVVGRIGDA